MMKCDCACGCKKLVSDMKGICDHCFSHWPEADKK